MLTKFSSGDTIIESKPEGQPNDIIMVITRNVTVQFTGEYPALVLLVVQLWA